MRNDALGRYLSPEPLLQNPRWVASELRSGRRNRSGGGVSISCAHERDQFAALGPVARRARA